LVPALDSFAPRVIAWQREQGRHHLPWQDTRDPYRVWLSEIMLQQTQVATVLAYYERFLQRFPDVATLAEAALDDVLALWSGLGYYSRARNLHRCAQVVVSSHGGHFPRDSEQLALLPGIGRSTAAAIAAFCYAERAAILDGNVKRVLTRVLGFDGDLAQAANERELWRHATALLPSDGIGPYTQGLMDLGANLCAPTSPRCLLCPVQPVCAAQRAGDPERYPVKSKKLTRGRRENWWLWLQWRGHVWLQQRAPSGVWGGLWTLPLFDDEAALQVRAQSLGATSTPTTQPSIRHALTHFDWLLHPRRITLSRRPSAELLGDGRWVKEDELASIALPAPLRRLLAK
jgi:A/G-specific adenine glycosylase